LEWRECFGRSGKKCALTRRWFGPSDCGVRPQS
jgi:hypothetical protein